MSEIAGFGQLFEDAFGNNTNEKTTGNTSSTGSTKMATTAKSSSSRSLEIGQDAVNKIISDVLGSATGLKDIFSQENVAGIFNGTTANQLTADLTSRIVGEIAKLLAVEKTTGEEETAGTQETKETGTATQSASTKDKGLVGTIADWF
jgi:hypothetical protein